MTEQQTTSPVAKRTRRPGTSALMTLVSLEHKAFIEEAATVANLSVAAFSRRVLLKAAAESLDRLPPNFDYGKPGRSSSVAAAAEKAGLTVKEFRKKALVDAVAAAAASSSKA